MKRLFVIIPIGILAFSLTLFNGYIEGSASRTQSYNSNAFDDDKKCSFCHNDIIKHEVLHAPVADDCESCHMATGNKHPKANLRGFELAEQTPGLCSDWGSSTGRSETASVQ